MNKITVKEQIEAQARAAAKVAASGEVVRSPYQFGTEANRVWQATFIRYFNQSEDTKVPA